MTCSAYQREFRGWAGACVLENGLVRLVAVPDIGGRVMACDLGPYPFLFVDLIWPESSFPQKKTKVMARSAPGKTMAAKKRGLRRRAGNAMTSGTVRPILCWILVDTRWTSSLQTAQRRQCA